MISSSCGGSSDLTLFMPFRGGEGDLFLLSEEESSLITVSILGRVAVRSRPRRHVKGANMAEKMLMTQALVEELVTQNKILLAKKNISEATWKHNDAIIMEAYTKKLPIPELLTQDPTERLCSI
jgi:hypothetical protein